MNSNSADQRGGAQPYQLNNSQNLGSPNRQDLIYNDDEPMRPRPIGNVNKSEYRSSDVTHLNSEGETGM